MYKLKVDWLFYSQSTCTLPTSLDTMTCLEMLGSGLRTTSMDWTVTAATGIMTTSPPPALMVDITLFWWALENTCTWFYLRRVKAFRKSVRLPWFYCRCLIFHKYLSRDLVVLYQIATINLFVKIKLHWVQNFLKNKNKILKSERVASCHFNSLCLTRKTYSIFNLLNFRVVLGSLLGMKHLSLPDLPSEDISFSMLDSESLDLYN